MKKIILIFTMLALCSSAIFADDQGDEYDDGFVYEANGAGDQFVKISLGGLFPLNYGDKLDIGGGATIGFFKFISNKWALGGEFTLSDNFTIGDKPLITVPITFNVFFQPTINNFEFPLSFGVGVAALTMTSKTYFPGLSVRFDAGAFYRISESWSVGIESSCYWIPEWHQDPKFNENLFMATANVGVRFHF